MAEPENEQERPCLHCMMVELIDDFFAEYPPAPGRSDKASYTFAAVGGRFQLLGLKPEDDGLFWGYSRWKCDFTSRRRGH